MSLFVLSVVIVAFVVSLIPIVRVLRKARLTPFPGQ
jgi:hypothetical protein